jgi:hypothetical protein
MADPVTVVGIVTNAFQLIEFGLAFCREAREIAFTGLSTGNKDVQSVTDLFIEATQRLADEFSGTDPGHRLHGSREAIFKLAKQCIEIGTKLQDQLRRLDLNGTRGKWKSIRQTMKSIWKRKEIDDISRRLSMYRSQLQLHLQEYARKERSEFEDHVRSMLQQLQDRCSDTTDSWKRNADLLQSWLDGSSKVVDPRMLKALHAIQTMEDSFDIVGPHATTPNDKAAHSQEVELRVLRLLHFEEMSSRFYAVAEAHKSTFRWSLARTSDATQSPESLLSLWLETGKGVYHISGKAGSGKSTLMKYICSTPETLDCLRLWAHDHYLLTASFFAWHSGTIHQKSETGLLRSILYQILRGRPDLIRQVLPTQFQIAEEEALTGELPSFRACREAIATLALLTSEPASPVFISPRICIFIDGLDEFDHDQTEIASFLLDLSNNHFGFKAVISGRPLIPFESVFSSCPQIRLQDLTEADIRRFVYESLNDSHERRQHERIVTGRSFELFDSICNRANGVFVWVALTVKTLRDALREGDSFDELFMILDELPTELEALYQHMFDKRRPHHRRQAAQYFRIVEHFQSTCPNRPLPLLYFTFIDENINMRRGAKRISNSNDANLYERCRETEKRIRAKSCGLIEVHHAENRFGDDVLIEAEVQYFHDSVREFLRAGPGCTQKHLLPDFDIESHACWAHLNHIETSIRRAHDERIERSLVNEASSAPLPTRRSLWKPLASALHMLREHRRLQTMTDPPLLDMLMKNWKRGPLGYITPACSGMSTWERNEWYRLDDDFCFAIQVGLIERVRDRLSRFGKGRFPPTVLRPFRLLFRSQLLAPWKPQLQSVHDIAELLLEHGGVPIQSDFEGCNLLKSAQQPHRGDDDLDDEPCGQIIARIDSLFVRYGFKLQSLMPSNLYVPSLVESCLLEPIDDIDDDWQILSEEEVPTTRQVATRERARQKLAKGRLSNFLSNMREADNLEDIADWLASTSMKLGPIPYVALTIVAQITLQVVTFMTCVYAHSMSLFLVGAIRTRKK